jgi:hypothetical protein
MIAIVPRPKHRETLVSFLSRLAASKRADATDFAHDMGASFKRVLNSDEEAISLVLEWGKLSTADMHDLLSWTGERVGNVRMKFRGEVFVSRALRNPVMRGCPICLREDVEADNRRHAEVMAMRGDWLLREATLCIRHDHLLVPLWRADQVTDRENVGQQLTEISDKILQGGFDRLREPASPYDLWLDGRLESGHDTTWLANHTLYAASTFCRLLGAAMLDLKIAEVSEDIMKLRAAQATGYDIARQGPVQIRSALNALARRASGTQHQPRKAFGQLFTKMNSDYLQEEAFTHFRQILRDCILSNWQFAAGETILGEIISKRLIHSLHSAAVETGVGTTILEKVLNDAGAFEDAHNAPNRKIFDAQKFAPLLAEISELVGAIEMQRSMGATRTELSTLERDRILIPRTRTDKIKSPWRLSDGLALVEELQSFSSGLVPDDIEWESIQQSSKRTGKTVGAIILEIRSRKVQVKLRSNVLGYHGIWVCKSDVGDRRKSKLEILGEHTASVRETTSAYAFARSIGLRERGLFQAFLSDGHSPAILALNPDSQRSQFRMTDGDIAAFHRKFLTLTTMEGELGLHRNAISCRLRASGVLPFVSDGKSYGAIWSRHAASRVLADLCR